VVGDRRGEAEGDRDAADPQHERDPSSDNRTERDEQDHQGHGEADELGALEVPAQRGVETRG
jgi:hypothetical protein